MSSLLDLVPSNLLEEDVIDPRWLDSPFLNLKRMKAKQAGSRYEHIFCSIMSSIGFEVSSPTSTDHDVILDGIKTEIKGSMLNRTQKAEKELFSFLQIRPEQEYEQVGLICFYFNKIRIFLITKNNINQMIENRILKKQHGGNKANSKTFCFNGDISKIEPYAKEILPWS